VSRLNHAAMAPSPDRGTNHNCKRRLIVRVAELVVLASRGTFASIDTDGAHLTVGIGCLADPGLVTMWERWLIDERRD